MRMLGCTNDDFVGLYYRVDVEALKKRDTVTLN